MGEIINQWMAELKKQGISDVHIESMKERILLRYEEYSLVYDQIHIDELKLKSKLVDVSKIGGINTSWTTADRSVYELFFSVTGELQTEQNAINFDRIEQNLNSLINNGLVYQHYFYIDSTKEYALRDGLPKFDYFLDDDVYFSGATHRTISAIMFNAPQMVGYVTTYRKNETKVLNYSKHIHVKKKWNDFLRLELNSLIVKKHKGKAHYNGEFRVYYKNIPNALLTIIQNPILKVTNENLIDIEIFVNEEKRVNGLINKLQEIDNSLLSKKLSLLPLPLRLVKENIFLYSVIAELYVRGGKVSEIDIINDSLSDIVKKIQRVVRNQIISDLAKKN